MTDPTPRPRRRFSTMLRVVALIVLLLALLVPEHLISGLIFERELRQSGVEQEFQTSWGPVQVLRDDLTLVIPYAVTSRPNGKETFAYLHVAPRQLAVTAKLTPELRHRGMFSAVVYTADVVVKGSMVMPTERLPDGLLWDRAFISLDAKSLPAAASQLALTWDGKPLGWSGCPQESCGDARFLMAQPGLSGPLAPGATIPFETKVTLRGTQSFSVQPSGEEWSMALSGDWPSPSFAASALPTGSTITDHDFSAHWALSNSFAAGRLAWRSRYPFEVVPTGAAFADGPVGASLIEAVPTYQMVDRADKYGLFFLILALTTYFLLELVARVRIHIAQYGLLGLSMTLFALLLISLAEPLGFTAGYIVAAFLVLLQATLHTAAVTKRVRHTAIFSALLTGLFAFDYVALRLESASLLAGALMLFAALSLVMAVTRRIDWDAPKDVAINAAQ